MIERTKHGGHITDAMVISRHSPIISWSKQSANFQSLTEGVFRITQIESEIFFNSVPYGFTLPQIDRE